MDITTEAQQELVMSRVSLWKEVRSGLIQRENYALSDTHVFVCVQYSLNTLMWEKAKRGRIYSISRSARDISDFLYKLYYRIAQVMFMS